MSTRVFLVGTFVLQVYLLISPTGALKASDFDNWDGERICPKANFNFEDNDEEAGTASEFSENDRQNACLGMVSGGTNESVDFACTAKTLKMLNSSKNKGYFTRRVVVCKFNNIVQGCAYAGKKQHEIRTLSYQANGDYCY